MDRDDPRGLSHRSACHRPFTLEWEYYKKYGLNNLAELKAHQIRLKTAESGEVLDVAPSSKTRQAPTNRPQTSQASQRRSRKRGKSADTRSSDANVSIPSNNEINLAKKVLRIIWMCLCIPLKQVRVENLFLLLFVQMVEP